MAVIGNAPFQGLVSGGNIIDASIEGVDLSTSAIAARLGYTPVDPGAAAITGGTINGATIGATTAASGSFTTVSASGAVTLNGLTASTALALDASKNLVSVTNTGSGNNVLATSPTLVTPVLGTPTSGNFSTGTFTWPTFNQNTTGTAAGLSATLATTSGGTGLTAFTANGVVYASSTSALATGSALTFDGTTLTATGTSPIKVAYVSGPSQFTTVNYDGLSVSGAQDAYYIAPSGRTQFWYLGAAEQMRLNSTGLAVTGNLSITSPAFTDSIATINSTSTNVSQRLNFTANGTLQTQIYDDSTETRISAVTTKSLAFRTDNAERLRITSIGQFSLAYAGFQIQSPAGSLSFPQGASLQTGGFGRAWNPAQQIGQGSNAGLYGMAHTYLAYYDGGWKSLGGGHASAITIDEGNFSFSNTNGVGATNSALTWTTRMFINTSGNIGMGTVSPATRLEIREDTSSRNTVTNMLTLHNYSATNPYDGFGNGIVFKGLDYSNAPQTYASIVGGIYATDRSTPQPDTGFAGILKFLTGTNGANTERMSISSTQMLVNVPVGIGTSSPAGILDAGGNTLASQFYFRNNGSYGSGGGGQTVLNVVFGGFNIASIANTGTGQRDGIFKLLDENVVKVSIPANTARGGDTYFNAGGNFAIGTTSALAKLHVEGNTLTLNTENSAQAKILYFRYSNGATIQSDSYLTFGTGGSPQERMRITSAGNLGIGNTTALTKLSINSPAHDSPTQPGTGRILNWYSGSELWNNEHSITVGNNNSSTTQPMHVGLSLFNNSTANYTWSPAITFNGLSINGGYMNSGAAIAAQLIDNPNDQNFRGGNLHFYTSPLTASNKGLASRMIIDYEGKVGINQNIPQAKLHISGSNSTAFNAADNSWHSVIVNNQASASTHASGICFEVSNNAYHTNAGTGIAAVKNGINSDYGSDLVFITRGQNVSASEKMRILGNGKINTAGVSVFYTSGYSDLTTTFYIDVPVENDNPGLANTYHIEASISHANWSNYGALLDTWYNARGAVPASFTEQYDTRVVNSGNGGSWTISKPATNSLRITHNAGTYGGGAYYWIRVTMNA